MMTWHVDVAAGEDAFSVVYRRCHEHMVRLAYLLTGDLAGAEELAHDAWVNVYRAHVDSPIADIESYVRRSLINEARSRARRRVSNVPTCRAFVRGPRRIELRGWRIAWWSSIGWIGCRRGCGRWWCCGCMWMCRWLTPPRRWG